MATLSIERRDASFLLRTAGNWSTGNFQRSNGDMIEDEDLDEDSQAPCPICQDPSWDCDHHLLTMDTTVRTMEGGVLYERFMELEEALCKAVCHRLRTVKGDAGLHRHSLRRLVKGCRRGFARKLPDSDPDCCPNFSYRFPDYVQDVMDEFPEIGVHSYIIDGGPGRSSEYRTYYSDRTDMAATVKRLVKEDLRLLLRASKPPEAGVPARGRAPKRSTTGRTPRKDKRCYRPSTGT